MLVVGAILDVTVVLTIVDGLVVVTILVLDGLAVLVIPGVDSPVVT